MGVIKWIWSYLKNYRLKYFTALSLVLIVSGLNMINPLLAGRIVDKVINGGNKTLLVPILLTMISIVVVKSLILYTYQMIFEITSQGIIFDLRETLYKKLMEMDFEFYNSTRTGDLMARLTGDTDAIRHFLAWVVYNIVSNLSAFIFAIISMSLISLKLTIFMISITPLIAFFTFKLTKVVGPAFFAIRESFSRLNSVVQENISGNRVVKAFGREAYEIEKFKKSNLDYKEKNLKAARIWEKYLPVLDSLAGVLSVIMIFAGGILVINKKMTLGNLVVFNGYLWALNNPMRMSGWLVNDVERFRASTIKIRELINTEAKIKNDFTSQEIKQIKGNVRFHNVSFSYGKEEILKNVSFQAKCGETIGILGPTGSGKSTLINLMCRFYDCSDGNIYIDDIDIGDYEVKTLRSNIAIAMQDIFLFSDTIEGNIAYGNPNASLEQVQKVAAIAEAHEFILDMPEGYDTIIGERGVGLSGGQKQRIALARALLKNPSILMLDDTTSSVDMETEYKIQREVNSIYNTRTNFIIAHRISSVKNASLILVLDNGEIVERGTHEELINQRGYYYSVYQTQFGDFDIEKEVV
jgi:ATP-binding cassette, subfamily B, multidrug efflux pump